MELCNDYRCCMLCFFIFFSVSVVTAILFGKFWSVRLSRSDLAMYGFRVGYFHPAMISIRLCSVSFRINRHCLLFLINEIKISHLLNIGN